MEFPSLCGKRFTAGKFYGLIFCSGGHRPPLQIQNDLLDMDQSALDGNGDSFGPVGDLEFGQDRFQVTFGRML